MSTETLQPKEATAEKIDTSEVSAKEKIDTTLTDQAEKDFLAQAEKADNERDVLDILQNHIGGELIFEDNKLIAILADSSELKPEIIKEALALMRHLESCIGAEDIAKISEMAKQKESDGALEKKNQIVNGLITPVLRGHLTAEDVKAMVTKISLFDPKDPNNSSRLSAGYEGLMLCDQENNEIKISTAVFANEHKTDDDTVILLDAEHMATHELSHTVATHASFKEESWDSLKDQMVSKEPQFSSEMIKRARFLIDNAEEMKDSQSMHIRNVLDSIENIETDYKKLPSEEQQKTTLEDYRNQRLAIASVEIITEYTALFLESDGTFKDFVRNCLEKANENDIIKYLTGALKTEEESDEEAKKNAPVRFKRLLANLKGDENNIETVLSKNPGLKNLFDNYKIFYKQIHHDIHDEVKGVKGKLGENDDDEFDWDSDFGGYYDGYGGFGAERGQGGKSQGNDGGHGGAKEAVLGLVSAFAEEVDVTKGMK